jgi:hypothetical protein
MSHMEDYKPCLKCDRPGIERCVQTLRDKGTLIKVIHDDGSICEFVEYPSVSTFLVRGSKDPKIMDCPACREKGRIGNYRPDKNKESHIWKYFIVHEQLEGYWGRNHKIKRYRRCYMKTEEQRNEILEWLRRYRS